MRLFTAELRERLRERRHDPTFARAWAALDGRAARALAAPVAIPAEGGGWGHDYFCPEHATRLEYDPARPHAHRCPIDGRVFSGEPYDGAWRSHAQGIIVGDLLALAIVSLATDEGAYAARAGAILREYAARYPRYPVHGEHAGQGRCLGQSLDEAVWSIPLARAYDAVAATLSADDRALIARDLLRPLGEHLLGQLWRRVHNIECWHLAGLATVGAALDEPRFLAPALDPDHGLGAQLAGGVLDDGWWWEGSPTYHFYTLQAVTALAAALRGRHPVALADPRLSAMLGAPFGLARDDLSLAATNDGWLREAEPDAIGAYAPVYEAAYGLWADPAHAAQLARLYAAGAARTSPEALLFGPATLPAAAPVPAASAVHDASGYAVLRGGDLERWLLLKYGPHGGGHGHPDKLALDLHAFGRPLAADLGTPGYGIPLNRTWYRETLAHNTFLIDGTAQPPATGHLVRFVAPEEAPFGVADAIVSWPADAPAPYAGVAAGRCILWKGGDAPYFLDIVRVAAPGDAERTIDLAWHHAGTLDAPGLAAIAPPSGGDAYAHLGAARQLSRPAVPAVAGLGTAWRAVWRDGTVGTACWALDPPGAVAVATLAPGNPAAESLSLTLRRATGTAATFVAVFEPFAGEPRIRRVSWRRRTFGDRSVLLIGVAGDGWRDEWRIAEPSGVANAAATESDSDTALTYRLDPLPVAREG